MIYLGDCRDNIQVVAEQWANMLYDFMFKERKKKLRIKGKKRAYETYYEKMEGRVELSCMYREEKDYSLTILRWFKANFRTIVLAGEKELHEYSQISKLRKQWKWVPNSTFREAWGFLKSLMLDLYVDFTQYKKGNDNNISNAHYFFQKLNVKTCPYCNRHYTFTLDDGIVKVSPEYDHFYDKSSHPILAVSFYNLVPSCHTCNHVKGTKATAKINPYFSGFKSKFSLLDEKGDKLIVDYDKVSIKERRNELGKLVYSELTDEEKGNVETFGLQGLYEMHDDYIKELVDKVIAYNPTVRQALADAFEDQAYSPQQVYDFVWGRYLEEAQHGNRPLSKLTKDILEQLGILPDNDFR